MKDASDVTLSVFNVMWFRELVRGLHSHGFAITSIGTSRTMEGAALHHPLYPAFALQWAGVMAHSHSTQYAAMELFHLLAPFYIGATKAVWGLTGVNHQLFRKARKLGIPIVADSGGVHKRQSLEVLINEHKIWDLRYPSTSVSRITRRAELEYELADYIVGGSTQVRNSFLERGFPAEKVIVNPYGVDTHRWCAAGTSPGTPCSNRMIFIYTASIGLRKGIHYLLQAWKKLSPKNAELWICGTGNMEIVTRFRPLPDSIRVLGQKSHAELTALYSRAHVYVLPSLLEGLARSGIEAMAAGLAPIVTPATGLDDYIQDGVNGWFIPSRDVDSLAHQIQYCTQNPDRVEEVRQEARKISGDLSFEEYGRRSSEILTAIIHGESPPAFPTSWAIQQ
jgi:glycosyltransferase involved in cell wall biosynthesis